MDNLTGTDSAMDLSLRNPLPTIVPASTTNAVVNIIKPIPRPPWSIVWYRNLWSLSSSGEAGDDALPRTKLADDGGGNASLGIGNCLKANNTTVENKAPTYEFPFAHLIFNQNHEARQRTAVVPSSATNVSDYASCAIYNTNLQETQNLTSNQPIETGAGDCSCDASLSVDDDEDENEDDEDDLGNESENSENIVVTTIGSEKAGCKPQRDHSKRMHQKCTEGSLVGLRHHHHHHHLHQTGVILDVACCDGPVHFKRISNPNFAVTVEHGELCPSATASVHPSSSGRKCGGTARAPKLEAAMEHHKKRNTASATPESTSRSQGSDQEGGGLATLKSYLCIYCNQSFKSLFCYQKHKKRHLNPVSVDITTTMENSTSQQRTSTSSSSSCRNEGVLVGSCASNNSTNCNENGVNNGGALGTIPDNTKAKTKDLNVQFFPCKKCGCKFPSYYFVHKHRKICH